MIVDNVDEIFKFSFSRSKFVLHLAICFLIYLIPIYAVFIPVIIGLLFHFYRKNKSAEILTLGAYSLCCKGEAVFYSFTIFLFLFLFFIKNNKKTDYNYNRLKSAFSILILYLVVLYIIQIFSEGSALSLPFFFLTFFSPIVILFYVLKKPLSLFTYRSFFINLIHLTLAQLIITLVFQAIPLGIGYVLATPTSGDFLTGTTTSANLLAFLACVSILPLAVYTFKYKKVFKKKSLVSLGLIFFFIGMVYLNDGKARFYAFILGTITVIFYTRFLKYRRIEFKLIVIGSTVLILIFSFPYLYSVYLKLLVNYSDYIVGNSNAKFEYFKDVFDFNTRSVFQYVFGTGAGTNGSRSANALAYDVLYKSEASVKLPDFIPATTNDFTRRYLAKLYTPEYALTTHQRSAMLGNPFNSVCAMFVEFGIVGSFLFVRFIYVLYDILRDSMNIITFSGRVLIIVVFILGVLDQSLETGMIMFFFYLYISIAISLKKQKNNYPLDTKSYPYKMDLKY